MKQTAKFSFERFFKDFFLNTYVWLWSVVVLAALVCGLISWVHYQYQHLSERTIYNLGQIRQARVEMSKGFLYLNLANDPSSIFDREEGMALIHQAINTINTTLPAGDQPGISLVTFHVLDKQTRENFREGVNIFNERLNEWSAARYEAVTIANLRIAYADLEHRAEQLDSKSQKNLEEYWSQLNTTFVVTLWVAALLLIVICMVIFFAARTREQSVIALRESEERFRTIIENSSAGYFNIGPDGRFREVNRAWLQMHAYDVPEEVIGRPYTITQVQEDIRGAQKNVENALKGITVRAGEFSRRRKDGSIGYHIFSLTPVKKGNQIVGMEGFLIDTTERKRAEEALYRLNEDLEQRVQERTNQLEAANRELKAFNYSVSHDLRAPIRTINGFSSILMEDYAQQMDGEAQRLLERIHSETIRMGSLIDHLLQLSMAANNKLQQMEVNLSGLAQKVIARLQEENPRVKMAFVVQPDLAVNGDPDLLEILLTNLMGNAVKFSQKNPHPLIEFGAKMEGGQRAFFVRDNGAGFDMTKARHMFEAFQRMHTTSEYPGNGIGLAIVQRIVKRYNGSVWAESQVGQGATFFFILNDPDKESN